MNIPFVKMQAQGNDFVILDGMDDTLPALTQAFIKHICDRHLGMGCDQLLVLQASDKADALMLIYNADGSQAANCGNGLRCVGDLLMRKLDADQVSIALADRVVEAKRTSQGVQVAMGKANIEEVSDDYTDVLIGNPHRVYFKNPQAFPERNVETIHEYDDKHAVISIVERGAGKTLACGSGACATAVAIWHKTSAVNPLIIHMPGGDVVVSGDVDSLVVQGEVHHVFSGSFQWVC
ncbi:MAG: diaminopimelate epimerase [Ghiorsea sp.]|nr:diaminopimelate epimerase [Ghiorsea sp.]